MWPTVKEYLISFTKGFGPWVLFFVCVVQLEWSLFGTALVCLSAFYGFPPGADDLQHYKERTIVISFVIFIMGWLLIGSGHPFP